MDNNKNNAEKAIESIAPFLKGLKDNLKGFNSVLEQLKNDPSVTDEDREKINKKVKEAELENVTEKMENALKDLKKRYDGTNN